MKRFYCTVCKRIKRVRALPANTQTPLADSPENRIGKCDYHTIGRAIRPAKVKPVFNKPALVEVKSKRKSA